MPLMENGFLGKDAKEFVVKHRKEFEVWFEVAEELNKVAHEMIKNIKVMNNDGRKITCWVLFLRNLSAFSSAVKLLELGLCHDAGTVHRSQIESMIYLTGIVHNKLSLEEYVHSNEQMRLTMINLALEGRPGAFEINDKNRAKVLAIKEKLEELKQSGLLKKLNIEQIARDSGLEGFYNASFRLFSNTHSHPSATSLSEFFVLDENRQIAGVKWGPDLSNFKMIMDSMIGCMLQCMQMIKDEQLISKEIGSQLVQRAKAANQRIRDLDTQIPK